MKRHPHGTREPGGQFQARLKEELRNDARHATLRTGVLQKPRGEIINTKIRRPYTKRSRHAEETYPANRLSASPSATPPKIAPRRLPNPPITAVAKAFKPMSPPRP